MTGNPDKHKLCGLLASKCTGMENDGKSWFFCYPLLPTPSWWERIGIRLVSGKKLTMGKWTVAFFPLRLRASFTRLEISESGRHSLRRSRALRIALSAPDRVGFSRQMALRIAMRDPPTSTSRVDFALHCQSDHYNAFGKIVKISLQHTHRLKANGTGEFCAYARSEWAELIRHYGSWKPFQRGRN
jgi:hypothetical protein